jgi:hypothetical protein
LHAFPKAPHVQSTKVSLLIAVKSMILPLDLQISLSKSDVEKKNFIAPFSRATKSFLLTGPSRVDEPILSREARMIGSTSSALSLRSDY